MLRSDFRQSQTQSVRYARCPTWAWWIMNKIEASRLAAAAHAMRPDWPAQSVLTMLGQIAGWPMRDTAVQLAYIACDPETETPARILQDGPWRKLTRFVDGGAPQPLPYQPMFTPRTDAEIESAALAAKAAKATLAATKATLRCACGQSIPRAEWGAHTCEGTA